MALTSFSYLLLLFSAVAISIIIPYRYRWIILLIVSIYFYLSFIPSYFLIMILLIILNFFGGKMIQGKYKKRILFFIIGLNIGILIVFKYLEFFFSSLLHVFNIESSELSLSLSLLLPLGLSFVIFQLISYLAEVYKGTIKRERHFGIFSLSVLFSPKIIAGPIERPQGFLAQLHHKVYITFPFIISGFKLLSLGFFKKMVIADRLGVIVDTVYQSPEQYVGVPLIIATLAFTFQLYCDFSGYTDIARGSAMFFGYDFVENFRFPYISRSIKEFWRRWHISLSTWFRDYVYIPLGGNKVSQPRHYLNILVSFLLSGLWHGVGWNFVLWGFLHGVGVIASELIAPSNFLRGNQFIKILGNIFAWASTFLFITVTWILFRAQNFSDAWYVFTHASIGLKSFAFNLFRNDGSVYDYVFNQGNGLGLPKEQIFIAVIALLLLSIFEFFQARWDRTNVLIRVSLYILLVLGIINLSFVYERPFIYVQF